MIEISDIDSRGIIAKTKALIGYREADLRLCFGICKNPVFSRRGSYEGDSIYNEIALITPPTQGLELYTIYGMKDQGFTFRMVHRTLFYHSCLSSYRL